MFVKKTTKYYKEVGAETTITPKYKCYAIPNGAYYFYNVVDGSLSYNSSDIFSPTSDESKLTSNGVIGVLFKEIVSVSETDIKLITGTETVSIPRNSTYDFGSYTTTTTTVIPGTSDDYTYKEETLKPYIITKKDIIHKIGDFKREYQLVNSPKIDSNGIASGFNSRNGIQIGSFKPGSSPWEIGCLLTTGSDVSTSTIAFGSMNSTDYKCPLFGYISGKWRMLLSSNGSSWNLAADLTNGLVSPNTTYFVKFVFTGSRYILFVDDIPVIVLDSSTTIYQGGVVGFGNNMYSTSSQSYFNGTIDISKCYIKINGEYWWTGFYTENVLGVKRYLTNRNINNMIIVPSETILNTSTPGTYTLDLEDGDYDVVVVGAGGGGSGCSKHSDGASGASGSAFVGTITLTAGTYNVVVGAGGVGTARLDWSRGGTGGSSSIGDLIIAGGGTGGALDASGGTGGSLTLNIVPKSYTVKSNGRNGAGGYGWGQTSTVASPYGSYGYGGYGGQCDWQGGGTGGNGYISLIKLGYMKEK